MLMMLMVLMVLMVLLMELEDRSVESENVWSMKGEGEGVLSDYRVDNVDTC